MPHRESVEDILGRLMPPALSASCEDGICAMLDELAAESGHTADHGSGLMASARRIRPAFVAWAGGIAAAGAFAAVWLPSLGADEAPVSIAPVRHHELVLVSESGRVESMFDEGLQDLGDGSAMRATRMSVVEESRLLDEETGLVLQISEPREEVLLMPVSAF